MKILCMSPLLRTSTDFFISVQYNLEKTAGLLGFWDDSNVNEFLLPNGSFVHTNSSYRTLHNEFGQKCKLEIILNL